MSDGEILEEERNSLRLPVHRETLPDGLVDGRVGEIQPHQRDNAQRLASQFSRKLGAPRHDDDDDCRGLFIPPRSGSPVRFENDGGSHLE